MRTYTEREVSDIIERAVERQRAADEGDASPGLTLDEIERLGREAGIDPAHLRAAAEEVDAAGRTLTRQRSQTRTQVIVERWIDAPFTSAGWEDVVALLRERFGPHAGAMLASDAGESVQQVGTTYEWSHTSVLGVRTRVSVSPRGGRTRLRLTQLVGLSSPTVEGAAYGGVIAAFVGAVGLAVGSGMSGSVPIGVVAGLLAFLLAWAVAAPLVTVADRRWRTRKLQELDDLADDLAPLLTVASEEAASASVEGATSVEETTMLPEAARLDLIALGDAPEAEAPTNGPQRAR